MGPKAVLKLGLAILVAAAATLYAGDFIWFEYRVLKPRPNDPFEKLTFYYATGVKGGKVEVFEVPQLQTCIHSIFPHRGYRPCWRFNRSGVERISLRLDRVTAAIISPAGPRGERAAPSAQTRRPRSIARH